MARFIYLRQPHIIILMYIIYYNRDRYYLLQYIIYERIVIILLNALAQ